MAKKEQKENEASGLRLLKKGQNGIIKMIFSRMGIIILLLCVNILLLFAAFAWFRDFLLPFYGATAFFTVIMVIYLINERMNPTSKITWLIVIMLLPVFGSLLYLYTKLEIGQRAMKKRLKKTYEASPLLAEKGEEGKSLEETSVGAGALARYVKGFTGIPVYKNTTCEYFISGEELLPKMLSELEKAEKTIYLEYFIIEEGIMWGKILEVLAKKASEGIDVRVMYDGTCELMLLPKGYPKKLKALGIDCRVFSPATPFLSTHYNYRDHRKILTIDGEVAFTGGINLADRYININSPYGYWKDTAIMLCGEAVQSFELMFLQGWNLEGKTFSFPEKEKREWEGRNCGFVLPYYEDPLDDEHVGRQVYIDILNRSQRYVHIMTPYLILDGELESALTYASKRGVDVTILLPGIPDKKIPYALAKSHYASLVSAGVKIYEYTPGFVHAKVVVADDTEAVVGTINFDYRSLYHHFECAVYLHSVPCIADIIKDFDESVAKSKPVTEKSIKSEKLFYKIVGRVMKAIAPLM